MLAQGAANVELRSPHGRDLHLCEAARQGKYKATGIVYDAMTVPPGATAKTDTIAVRLDHADGYSVVVMTPYQRGSGGDVVKGTDFAVQGEGSIFPKR